MTTFSAAQRILVTGASSGIGRAIALLLNERGATVLANGRATERLEQVRNESADPSRMLLAPRDMTADMDALPAWLKGLSRQFGPLHGLVCSAGATWNAPMALYDLTKARQLFDLCCHAPLLLGGAFCDRRANTGAGAAIVFIAAAAAVAPNPGQGAYGAAKAALVAGAVCLAKEAAPRGVRVNCISPGLVQGPMMDATVEQLGQSFLEKEQPLYPLGFGKPQDVANMAAFMLSQEASWLTGQNIMLAGGR
ncbi:MAG: SDR family oxidoreductase [Desulfovibrio sp.]|uniref:SDR family NAD(P)-dependent oxidoreductase n=1 Tax=Desulfovibrio sp. TaxID=885 RepID=UPI00135DBBB4|nr:SDR family oxidoreductase [Desulfovibrio sp.]MTJ92984.1 SDR family oxidoreductase [Desulfovibrio sp.]